MPSNECATRIDATLIIFEFMDLKINHIIAQSSLCIQLCKGASMSLTGCLCPSGKGRVWRWGVGGGDRGRVDELKINKRLIRVGLSEYSLPTPEFHPILPAKNTENPGDPKLTNILGVSRSGKHEWPGDTEKSRIDPG